MPLFIKLNDENRKRLFNSVKKNINSSWDKFYPSLGVSRSMFFHYLSGKHNLPKKIFRKLEGMAGIKINAFEQIMQNKYEKKEMVAPKMSELLAEILGVLNGDGHISKFKYEVCVVGDLREKDYYNYLQNLFGSVFRIFFTIYETSSCLKLRTYSINLSNFLTNQYKLPKGNKLKRLRIPRQVFSSKKLLAAYLRGLFDTDGSFYIRRNNEPVVQITSASPIFLKEIREALISFNFNVARGNQRIFLYHRKDIKRFFESIKPANPKHLKKYQNYLKLYLRG